MIPQAVDNTAFTAFPTTLEMALPITSPTLLNIPVIFFHIPLKKSTIGLNILFIPFTAPLNISLKKFLTPANIFFTPFHIPLNIPVIAEKTLLIALTAPLNIL